MQNEAVSAVVSRLASNPWLYIVKRWNWKSALTSATIRGVIFFSANLSAGRDAAIGAMEAEFLWRFIVAGFLGSIIQSLRKAQPIWQATLITSIGLPIINHSIEFTVHYMRGTPKLRNSMIASICFTAFAMLFNTYAMRQGVMVTGKEGKPLWLDLLHMPRIFAGFILWILRIQRSPQSL